MAEHVLPNCHPLSSQSRRRGYQNAMKRKHVLAMTPYPRDAEGLTPRQGLMVALLSLGLERKQACKMLGVTLNALQAWSRSELFKQAVARRANEFQSTVNSGLRSAVLQVISHLQRLLVSAHSLQTKDQINLYRMVLDAAGFKGVQSITNIQVNNYEDMNLEQLKAEIESLKSQVMIDAGFEIVDEPDAGKDPPA